MEAAITVDTVEVRDKSKSMTKTERNVITLYTLAKQLLLLVFIELV